MTHLRNPGVWVALLACMAVVAAVRLLPMTLDGARSHAHRVVLEEQMLTSLTQAVAAAPGDDTAWVEGMNRNLTERLSNRSVHDATVETRTEDLREHWRLTTTDGRTYPYPADLDTFLWLRNTRNVLDHGSACDPPLDGPCRNTLGLAPTGHGMIYHKSLHTVWLAAFHRLATLAMPSVPLEFSGQIAVLLIAVAGVIPAFMLGLQLVGNLPAAINGALLGAMYPVYLLRSRGLDNDVWNAVLPLFALWALARAMRGRHLGIAGWLACAVIVTAQAWVWAGWIFIYTILMATLAAMLLGEPLRRNVRGRRERLARLVCGIALMIAVPWTLMSATGLQPKYADTVLAQLPGPATGAVSAPVAAGGGNSFPRTLDTVAELADPGLAAIVASAGHPVYLQLALLGLVLLLRFRGLWDGAYWIVVCGTLVVYGTLLSLVLVGQGPEREVMVGALALPVLVAAVVQARSPQAALADRETVAVALTLWLLGAFYLSMGGHRFLLLLAPPLGLGIGLAIGIIYRQALAACGRRTFTRRWVRPLLATLAITPLVPALAAAYTPMRYVLPSMSDTWWLPLEYLSRHTPEDAIVTTQWSHGYFVSHVARRATPADGGVLSTHAPYWVDRALASDNPDESLGILRMLHCAGDGWPLPEGRLGGYGLLRASGMNSRDAHLLLLDILPHPRNGADRILEAAEIDSQLRTAVLDATHCQPRPGYLVVSDRWLINGAPLHLGLWNPRRPVPGGEPSSLPEHGAREQAQVDAELETGPETVPRRGVRWTTCTESAHPASLLCPFPTRQGVGLVTVSADESDGWRLVLRTRGQPANELNRGWIVHLDADGVRETGTPDISTIGAVIDLSRMRLFDGSARTLSSLFGRLAAMDGYQVPWASRVYEHVGPQDTVSVWRIAWP